MTGQLQRAIDIRSDAQGPVSKDFWQACFIESRGPFSVQAAERGYGGFAVATFSAASGPDKFIPAQLSVPPKCLHCYTSGRAENSAAHALLANLKGTFNCRIFVRDIQIGWHIVVQRAPDPPLGFTIPPLQAGVRRLRRRARLPRRAAPRPSGSSRFPGPLQWPSRSGVRLRRAEPRCLPLVA